MASFIERWAGRARLALDADGRRRGSRSRSRVTDGDRPEKLPRFEVTTVALIVVKETSKPASAKEGQPQLLTAEGTEAD